MLRPLECLEPQLIRSKLFCLFNYRAFKEEAEKMRRCQEGIL